MPISVAQEAREVREVPDCELLGQEALAIVLGISRSTLDRMRRRGEVLTPLVLAGRSTRWRKTEVLEWIREGCPSAAEWAARGRERQAV